MYIVRAIVRFSTAEMGSGGSDRRNLQESRHAACRGEPEVQSSEPDPGSSFTPETWPCGFGPEKRQNRIGRAVFTERTNAARLKLDRLRAIATEAAEQCGRLTLPGSTIHSP